MKYGWFLASTIITSSVKIENTGLGMAAAEPVGFEGPAPKTVDPLELVVFRTDELVLHFETQKIMISVSFSAHYANWKKKKELHVQERSPS